MRNLNPPIKREYVKPKVVEKIMPSDGTEWRCSACGVDLFGKFKGGELHIKYSARNIFIETGVVRVGCRRCNFENVISMEDFVINVISFNANSPNETIRVTPRAQELAEKHQIDLRELEGSGKEGQILVIDVKKMIG